MKNIERCEYNEPFILPCLFKWFYLEYDNITVNVTEYDRVMWIRTMNAWDSEFRII